MLNLEWFRTFMAIYQTGNLTAAAQSLFISQPGVSLHLNALESYTGCRLFNRETRKMIPTERGVILYNCILHPLSELIDAEQTFSRNFKAEKPTISVGMGFETFEYTFEEHIGQLPFNLILRFGEPQQMLTDLDTGKLDLIVTPHKGRQPNLEFTAFTNERIVLVCGNKTNTEQFDKLVLDNDKTVLKQWLKQQVWFTSAADMVHLKSFWLTNFGCLPDMRPNYIVPYFSSIIRCLGNSNGFAVMPDFLCKKEIANQTITLVWEGSPYVENTLHFGKRKKTKYANEIRQLEGILTKSWF